MGTLVLDRKKAYKGTARTSGNPIDVNGAVYLYDEWPDVKSFREWLHEFAAGRSEVRLNRFKSTALASAHAWEYSTGEVRHTAQSVQQGLQQFSAPSMLARVKDEFLQQLSPQVREALKRPRLVANDRGFGVFSFDRAAQGMYRISEYYSPSLARKVDESEVVEDGSGSYQLRTDGSVVERRLETRADGRPKVRTNQRKVWLHFEKKPRSNVSVHLFVSCGNFGWLSGEDFLYSAMPAIVVAEACAKAGIQCRVDLVAGWSLAMKPSTRADFVGAVIPMKDYDQPLDENLFALLATDPAFWRLEGFHAIYALQLATYGRTYEGAGLIGTYLKSMMEQVGYRTDTKNRFYTGRTTGKYAALKECATALETISQSLEGSTTI